MYDSSNVKLLTEYEFCVLRFKVAKLLKTTHRRIKGIDVMDDGKIIVRTSFILSVEFNSIREIDDDFKRFCPDIAIPETFTSTDGLHRPIKRDDSLLVPLSLD